MSFPYPYRMAKAKDGSIRMEWELSDFSDRQNDGEYYPHCALSWPIFSDATGIAEGFAIVAIQQIKTGNIIVMGTTPFRNIDPMIDANGRIEYDGLTSWINAVAQQFLTGSYWWGGSEATHKQYHLELIRSKNLNCRAEFPEIEMPNVNDAVNVLYSTITREKLVMDSKRLRKDIDLWESTGRKIMLPSVWALLVLVNGFQRYPFRPRRVEEETLEGWQ